MPDTSAAPTQAMTGAIIAQLVVMFGPLAVDLITKLVETWSKPLSVAEVNAVLLLVPRKTYAEFIAAAEAAAKPSVS